MTVAHLLHLNTKLAHRAQLKRIEFLQTKAYVDFADHRIAVRDVAALVYTVIRLGLAGFIEFQEALPGHLVRLTGRSYSPYQVRSAIQTLCDLGYLRKPRKQDPLARLAKPYFITQKAIDLLETGFVPRVIDGGKVSHNNLRSGKPTSSNCTKDYQSLDKFVVSSSFVKNTIRARKDTTKSETMRPRKKSKPALLKNDTRKNIKPILWWIARCRTVAGQTEAAILQGRFAEETAKAGNRFEFWVHRWKDATGSEKSYFVREIVRILREEFGSRQEDTHHHPNHHGAPKGPENDIWSTFVGGDVQANDSECGEKTNRGHEKNKPVFPSEKFENNERTKEYRTNAICQEITELRHAMLFHGEYSGPHQYQLAIYRESNEHEQKQIRADIRNGYSL